MVNPGGAAQSAHRDYHLGFLSAEQAAAYPAHVHRLSPVLTLQGAVAHCDMPVETGPTMYLPYSQQYEPGYLAWRLPEFTRLLRRALRAAAAGEGRRGVLQPRAVPRRPGTTAPRTSSGWRTCCRSPRRSAGPWRRSTGEAIANAVFPVLRQRTPRGRPAGRGCATWSRAFAEGYAFPTNLDRDPPVGGLAPPSQADLVWQARRPRTGPRSGCAARPAGRHAARPRELTDKARDPQAN